MEPNLIISEKEKALIAVTLATFISRKIKKSAVILLLNFLRKKMALNLSAQLAKKANNNRQAVKRRETLFNLCFQVSNLRIRGIVGRRINLVDLILIPRKTTMSRRYSVARYP